MQCIGFYTSTPVARGRRPSPRKQAVDDGEERAALLKPAFAVVARTQVDALACAPNQAEQQPAHGLLARIVFVAIGPRCVHRPACREHVGMREGLVETLPPAASTRYRARTARRRPGCAGGRYRPAPGRRRPPAPASRAGRGPRWRRIRPCGRRCGRRAPLSSDPAGSSSNAQRNLRADSTNWLTRRALHHSLRESQSPAG